MQAQVSRMQFLRGDFKGREMPLRPPWAIAEELFVDVCTGCGECVTRCPTHIIKTGRASFPVVDFSAGECLFCEECIQACEPKALLKSPQPWRIHADINTGRCIAHQGVECRSCYDPCEASAISMPPQRGGISIPRVNESNCTGCGACIAVCPVDAISMNTTPDQTKVQQ